MTTPNSGQIKEWGPHDNPNSGQIELKFHHQHFGRRSRMNQSQVVLHRRQDGEAVFRLEAVLGQLANEVDDNRGHCYELTVSDCHTMDKCHSDKSVTLGNCHSEKSITFVFIRSVTRKCFFNTHKMTSKPSLTT